MKPPKFIEHITRCKDDFTPFTRSNNEYLFYRLEEILIEVEQWDCKIEISRERFESLIGNNPILVEEYIELFSNSARFVVSEIELDDIEHAEFFMMVDNKEIVLIFYQKSREGLERFL